MKGLKLRVDRQLLPADRVERLMVTVEGGGHPQAALVLLEERDGYLVIDVKKIRTDLRIVADLPPGTELR